MCQATGWFTVIEVDTSMRTTRPGDNLLSLFSPTRIMWRVRFEIIAGCFPTDDSCIAIWEAIYTSSRKMRYGYWEIY